MNWAQATSLLQRGERELAEKKPGEDNHESWAGTKKGEPLSPEAQKAYDEMLKSKNKQKKIVKNEKNNNSCKRRRKYR